MFVEHLSVGYSSVVGLPLTVASSLLSDIDLLSWFGGEEAA